MQREVFMVSEWATMNMQSNKSSSVSNRMEAKCQLVAHRSIVSR